jgi:hypothetical protein
MICPSCGEDPCTQLERCRYPYTHHGPPVYDSKLMDFLISEENMRADGLLPDDSKGSASGED